MTEFEFFQLYPENGRPLPLDALTKHKEVVEKIRYRKAIERACEDAWEKNGERK